MSPVLRGIAKFSHYINIEVVIDMLEILREFITRADLAPLSKLQCIVAAFQSLKRHGNIWHLVYVNPF